MHSISCRVASPSAPLICVVAPPGYGKTTVLAQWSGRRGPRAGWVSADRRDNDPVVLLTYIAAALDRVEPVDPEVFQVLAAPGVSVAGTAVPRVVTAASAMTRPVSLVLDHVELLENTECLDAVAELVLRLPAGSDAEVTELAGRTEGWPVGLYLAALALKAGVPRGDAGLAFGGDDRFIADYLHAELLLTELERREPGLVPQLHLRAAGWYEANGLPEAAIDHAQAAGDADRVARLVASLGQPTYAGGRAGTVLRWLRWFEDQGLVERYPPVAALGAWVQAVTGRPAAAERWADAAEREAAGAGAAPDAHTPPDGSSMESQRAIARALLCRNGVDRMLADARTALAGLSPASRWRGTALLLEGLAELLADPPGLADRADAVLAHAVEVGIPDGPLRPAPRRPGGSQGPAGPGRPAPAPAHLRPPLAVGADAAGDGAGLPAAGRHCGRPGRRLAGTGHPAAAAGPRRPARAGRGAVGQARHRPPGGQGGVIAVHRRAATAAAARHPPLVPEIGQRLYVSRNTVKTQAVSIYRKLGASSRSEAVQRLRELGLLGG